MRDQAERLRVLVADAGNGRQLRETNTKTRVISITSGKGGVGKTTLAVNLALAAQQAGLATVLFDADLGLANIDVVFGLFPRYNLMHVLQGEKTIGEIVCDGPTGLRLVAGGSGWAELANLNKAQLGKFIAGLTELDRSSDLIIIDTGAGLADSVLSFLHASEEIIVVTTPEPTAIRDAYAIIKVVGRQTTKQIHVVVNRAQHKQQASAIFAKIATTANRFLQLDLNYAGWLPDDSLITKTIVNQKPLLLQYPGSRTAQAIRQLQVDLCSISQPTVSPTESGMRAFFSRWTRLWGGRE